MIPASSDPPPFDLQAPLPGGTTLLEASAGTGKTFAIAALATRYIAEGRATIDQLLMITFGRSATRELRERVREALTAARDALRDPISARASTDPVIRSLAARPPHEVTAAVDRLSRATADFDSGTIATTHQFCLGALAGLGISADVDPGETFVEDISDLIDEVVDDLYVRKYVTPHDRRLDLGEARGLARRVVGDPQSEIHTGPTTEGSLHQARLRFASAVRNEVLDRRRQRRLVTYDDLVLRLQAALLDPVTGDQACRRLREQFSVVLVDEFQDTDPAQWTILREAFHGHRTLILIGDPKQAIYAFRGADVFSYLEAAGHADQHATLPTNHRSDAAVVRGIADLMGDLELGDERIVVHPVEAAHADSRLVGPGSAVRFRLRTWHPPDGPLGVGRGRATVADDVAADIVDTLTGPTRLHLGPGPERPVAPGDIAVLVANHMQATAVRGALERCGVPVVVSGGISVFATRAAEQWLTLLSAMLQPRTPLIRAAALTDFLGHTAAELAGEPDRIDHEVGLRLRVWAEVLESDSPAALFATVSQETGLAARALGYVGGERHLTDLRHVAGALHAEQRSTGCGLVRLVDWLGERVRRARDRAREASPELTQRLETDAEAVQVLTVHSSKGLQFPIAYVPFAWDRFDRTDVVVQCHDQHGQRIIDVRGQGAPGRSELLTAERAEAAGEELRLLYVALTRARCQVVVHWASSLRNTNRAPLHRVLCARREAQRAPALAYPVGAPPTQGLAGSQWILVESVEPRPAPPLWAPGSSTAPELSAAPFTRALDSTWRRTSYTGLTAGVHGQERAPSGFRDDEPADSDEASTTDRGPVEGDSQFAGLPAGASFGTLVHAVLESVDTSAVDLDDEVRTVCQRHTSRHPMGGLEPGMLAAAVTEALRTPLGPSTDGLALADIPPGDRLAELDFELPMGSGDVADPGARVTVADIADLLEQHLGRTDPMARYPDRLRAPGLGSSALNGYLSGSIDAVLRVPGPAGPRFLVVDYKTNLVRDPGVPGMEARVWGYRPEVLPEVMMAAHYPLQALLYNAALHRYLRWRLPGYEPQVHLGDVLYLFLRGMAGPDTPTQGGVPCGVFSWSPPADLVVDLSDLLDGRRP